MISFYPCSKREKNQFYWYMDSVENPLKSIKKMCVLYVQCSNSILFGFGVTGSHGFESTGGKRQNLIKKKYIQIKFKKMSFILFFLCRNSILFGFGVTKILKSCKKNSFLFWNQIQIHIGSYSLCYLYMSPIFSSCSYNLWWKLWLVCRRLWTGVKFWAQAPRWWNVKIQAASGANDHVWWSLF